MACSMPSATATKLCAPRLRPAAQACQHRACDAAMTAAHDFVFRFASVCEGKLAGATTLFFYFACGCFRVSNSSGTSQSEARHGLASRRAVQFGHFGRELAFSFADYRL